jgi:catechol O-methyltransferase
MMHRLLPPTAHLYSIELFPANAEIASKVVAHAGLQDRVTLIVGSIGDGGKTIQKLRDFKIETAGLVFLDHW